MSEAPGGGVSSDKMPIDLAAAPDFTIGTLTVRPSLRLIAASGREERLEPRVMQVLVALARAAGATVSRDSLIQSCWGGVIVGDDAINRVIARLRKVSAETNGAFRVETVPRVGFRLVPSERADAPAETAAAAGEPTTGDAADAAPHFVQGKLGQSLNLNRAVLAVLAVLIVTASVGIAVRAQSRVAERIAVLEFTAAKSLADEELPALLAARIRQVMSVNDLQIVARPETDTFRGPEMPAAARKVRVGYLLDGAVKREAGDLIVVQAEMIDARNNLTLWSREFRRKASEADFMLDQIATHVSYVFRCALVSRRAKSGPQDPETLASFLKACDEVNRYDGGRDEALESIRAVTRQVPKFSRGWSMLAVSAATASHYSETDQKEMLEAEARQAILRATALDRRNPEPLLAEAILLPTYRSFSDQEALIKRALKMDPNFPDAHASLGDLYLVTGRMAEAVAAYRRAAAADPLSPMNRTNLVPALSGQGKQEQAAAIRDELYRIWPTSPRVWMHRLHNASFAGRIEDAAAVLAGIDSAPFKMEPDLVDAFRLYLSAKISGDPTERRRAADRYVELALEDRFDLAPAMSALAEIGDLDRAFELARVYIAKPWSSSWPLFAPPTKNMRFDPRFIELANDVGLVDYWRQSGHWPDFCADPALKYDCSKEADRVLGRQVTMLEGANRAQN